MGGTIMYPSLFSCTAVT